MLIGGAFFAPQAIAVHTPPGHTRALTDIFPGDPKVDPFVLSADERRAYYTNRDGEAWLYDRTHKTKERVAAGPLWDLNLSPTGDALAYTRSGGNRDQFVWVLTLNATTGLALGPERQVSTSQGDVPSISPDGKSVAFARDDPNGVGQSIVVTPIGGGAERAVTPTIPSSIAHIRWTPDGKMLHLGVNSPVACVPEPSCLQLSEGLRHPPATILRVSVDGGDTAVVANTRRLSPGLSPDGTTLMYLDTGPWRRWVIANADGSQRATIALPPTQTPAGWLRGSELMIASSGIARTLRSMSLADGQSQVVVDDAESLAEPSWSPDSTLMMAIVRGAPHAELRLLSTNGAPPRTLSLPETTISGTAWSPDQKWIAYTGSEENSPLHVAIVDVATGRSRPLLDLANGASASLRWLSDSRGLVLTEVIGRQDKRRTVFRRVDLDGKSTVLREFAPGSSPADVFATDETTIVMQNDLLAPRPGDSPAALSLDGRWLAVRRATSLSEGALADAIEMARVDGSARKSIPLSFAAAENASPVILPGADQVIVFEGKRTDTDPSAYLVSAGTASSRRLFAFSSQYRPPDLAISPDGRTLLYLVWETLEPQVLVKDLSAARVR